MSRSAVLNLARAVLIAAAALLVAIAGFGVVVMSADLQDEADTLEEKS